MYRARREDTWRPAALEQMSFYPQRDYLHMVRPLHDELPSAHLPPDFHIRPLAGPDEVPTWVEMYNQTFIDLEEFQPMTVQQRLARLSWSTYRPEHDLIAIAPDGSFAAFCYCTIYRDENADRQQKEGWISQLGTRRGYRRMGLGRAMLLAGLHQLKAGGIDTARLGVDADSRTGATHLYEAVGFGTLQAFRLYCKLIDPA